MRRARPSSTPVQGDHPRWIRARTGATAKREPDDIDELDMEF